jgi:hypothetical protein
MKEMSEYYIEALQDAIRKTHGCASSFVESVKVTEIFKGQTVWDEEVEVFNLNGHNIAKQCYAWGYEPHPASMQYVAVLKLPPVDSPQKAVQAFILSQQKP